MALAQNGAQVVLAARRVEALERIKNEILSQKSDSIVSICQADVTSREDMKRLVEHASYTFGPVDIMVNNAGVMHFEMIKNVNQDEWDRTIDINCKGTLNGIASVLPDMLARKSGHIVNITSDAARKVFPGLGVYSASKCFVEYVSQALRLETTGSGIRVTCIQPGNVQTELVRHSNAAAGVDHEAMEKYGAVSTCPVLQAKDIGAAVVYCVSQPDYVAVNEILVEPRDEPI